MTFREVTFNMGTCEQDFVGLRLSSPFLIGSGPITTAVGEIHKHVADIAKSGWGGLVTKSIMNGYGTQFTPHLWSSPQYRLVGMQNSGPALTEFNEATIRALRIDIEAAHNEGLVVIPSLIGWTLEEWAEMAAACESVGADALELNLSCPSPRSTVQGSMGGAHIGQGANDTFEVVRAVVDSTDLPVMPKLTFHTSSPVAVARACQEAGAQAVAAINTVRGLIGIDIETGKPLSRDLWDHAYYSGLSGPLIKPLALGVTAEVVRQVALPFCGVGGIARWQDAVEFFWAGASTVQVCTAMMWYGFGLGKRLCQGLDRYLDLHGYASIDEFRGQALQYISSEIPDSYPQDRVVSIDSDKCNRCGLCVTACQDGAYGALSADDDLVRVDTEKCRICGLCMVVCKTGAISIVERP